MLYEECQDQGIVSFMEDFDQATAFDPVFLIHKRNGCNLIGIFMEALGHKHKLEVLEACRSIVEESCSSEGDYYIRRFQQVKIPFPCNREGFIEQWFRVQDFIQSKLDDIKDMAYETGKVTKTEYALDIQMKRFLVCLKNTNRHVKYYLGKVVEKTQGGQE